MPDELDFYRQHSAMSDPGSFTQVWDAVNPTIENMAATIQPLVFHYRGDGPFAENGIAAERIAEVNLRYAEEMLARIAAEKPITPGAARQPHERMVGCCRDWALLLVSLARHHGYAARSRVGFASYFADGWWIDHTVAEIWDESRQRWRLVDAQLPEPRTLPSGERVDPADLTRDVFLPGLDAWRRVRAGELAADTFVVAPEIPVPQLRGIPYLWHNVVLDLAALNRQEMILWDVWGIDTEEVNDTGAALLDKAAAAGSLDDWRQLYAMDAFRVPEAVLSFRPYDPEPPVQVAVRQVR